MQERYYVLTIQYNKEKQAENRTVPLAFDKLDDAIKQFHSQMAKDMGNETLGWAMSMVINSNGATLKVEKWTEPIEVVEEIVEEEIIKK